METPEIPMTVPHVPQPEPELGCTGPTPISLQPDTEIVPGYRLMSRLGGGHFGEV